jgi:RHS repeat-associated protein
MWGIASMKGHVARDGPWYGGRIELWTDYENPAIKAKIGEMHVWGTGGWELFTDQKNDFYGKGYGAHDIYFVFRGSGVANVDWIELELNGPSLVFKEAESFSGQSSEAYYPYHSICTGENPGNIFCGNCGDWVRYNGIDMKGGATSIKFKLSVPSQTCTLDVRLDGPDGILLGALVAQSTGESSIYNVQTAQLNGANIPEARGVHDLYLIFRGISSQVAHIDWFELSLKRLPYYRWEADWFSAQQGVYIISGEPRTIGGCDHGDWVRYDSVYMHKGAIAFKARMARDTLGLAGYVEIRVGNPITGPLLGTLASKGTGGWGNFEEQSTELDGDLLDSADGYRTLYLCFKNRGGVCNMDWFEITFNDQDPGQHLISASQYLDDVVFEKDKTNNVAYQYQNTSDGRMVFADQGNQTTWARFVYFKDHLGSSRMVLNNAGQVTEAMLYSAYGTMSYMGSTPAGTENTKEKFTGKELDKEGAVAGVTDGIGLSYFGARYYDAEIGMWTSADPALQDWALYSYCGGNPIGRVDIFGMSWKDTNLVSEDDAQKREEAKRQAEKLGITEAEAWDLLSGAVGSSGKALNLDPLGIFAKGDPKNISRWELMKRINEEELKQNLFNTVIAGGAFLVKSSGSGNSTWWNTINNKIGEFNEWIAPYQYALGEAIMSGGTSVGSAAVKEFSLLKSSKVFAPRNLSLFKGRFRIETGLESIPKSIQQKIGIKLEGPIQKPWHIVINGKEIPLNPLDPNWKFFK